MASALPEILFKTYTEGWSRIFLNAFWGVQIPYLPEYTTGRTRVIGLEGLSAYHAWLRFVTALSQLPRERQIGFDLRFRLASGADGSVRIELALLGRASQPGKTPEHVKVAIRNAEFAWHTLNGLLPPEYPFQSIGFAELAGWLDPYGNDTHVIEVRKRVVALTEHPLKQLPYRFRPTPEGILQTCRAMLERGRPCVVSIGVAPTELSRQDRKEYYTALASTVAGLPSTEQVLAEARTEQYQAEHRDLIQDLVNLGGVTRQSRSSLPIRPGVAREDSGALPQQVLTRLLSQADLQSAAAVHLYGQMLSAVALLVVRISVAAAGEPAREIAHALGAELAGIAAHEEALVLSGYRLAEDDDSRTLAERFKQATVLGDDVKQQERLEVLCTPFEAAAAFRLPLVMGPWSGIPTRPLNPFRPASAFWESATPPIAPQLKQRYLRLGRIVDDTSRYQNLPDYFVNLDDLTQHALIVGGTGSGKTGTGLQLVQQVREIRSEADEQAYVLLIDPVKTELRPLIRHPVNGREMLAFSVGSQFSPLHIDAFRVPDGVSPEQHLQLVTSCFSAAFPMGGPLELLLTRSIRDVYKEVYGDRLQIPLKPTDPHPETPEDILCYIAKKAGQRIETYTGEIRGNLTAAVQHRLEWLAEGVVGRAIVPRSGDRVLDVDTIMQNDVLIELRLLPGNEEKALVMALLLIMMGEYYAYSIAARGGAADTGGHLRHLTWMDEAQRLFSAMGTGGNNSEVANARGKVIELFVELLSEMRSRGEGLIISTQLPSVLDPRVRKHPGMKIMHRLTPEDDRSVLGATMDLDEEQLRFVTQLPAGQAVVFRGQMPAAVLVRVDDIRQEWAKKAAKSQGRDKSTADDWLRANAVPDQEIEAAMRSARFGRIQRPSIPKLGPEAPSQEKHTKACVACDGTCPSSSDVEMWLKERDRYLDPKVLPALKKGAWPELIKVVNQALGHEYEPAAVYCALAHIAQLRLKDGQITFMKHPWISDSLDAFAQHFRLGWARKLLS